MVFHWGAHFSATLLLSACATIQPTQTPPTPLKIEGQSTALMRSASFVTHDLEASVNFYKTYLGYEELGRREVTAPKSRKVIGIKDGERAYYVPMGAAGHSPLESPAAGVSFIGIETPTTDHLSMNPSEPSKAGSIILSHRVWGIEEMARRFEADSVPIIAELSPSGSGRSLSMAVLDPNGNRVELYQYGE